MFLFISSVKEKGMTLPVSSSLEYRDRYDSDRYRDGYRDSYRDGPRRDMDRYGGRDRYDDRGGRDYDRGHYKTQLKWSSRASSFPPV